MYTIYTTLLLGVVLVLLVYFTYLFFKRYKIKIDKYLLIGLSSWVFLSAIVRVFEDVGIYPKTFFTVSPGILILFAALFVPITYLGIWIEKNKKFELWKTLTLTAAIGILIHLPFIKLSNVIGALIIITIAGIIAVIIYAINKYVKIDIFSLSAVWTHMFDASATFTALTFYGYGEQHVLPTFLINLFGPSAMFILKLLVILPTVYVINKYSEDENLRKFLLLAVFAIGLAPALRDTLRLLMGV